MSETSTGISRGDRPFEVFAKLHPHEAHSEWPDRFWAFFQKQCPNVSREEMERLLAETDDNQQEA